MGANVGSYTVWSLQHDAPRSGNSRFIVLNDVSLVEQGRRRLCQGETLLWAEKHLFFC